MNQPPILAARQQLIAQQQQLQQQARSKVKQQKLKITFIGYLLVLMFLAGVQMVAVWFFSLGFLLSRQVLPNIAECDECFEPVKYDKAVVLVIDALRFDFVIPVEGSEKPYHNHFPILYDLAQGENGVLLKFIADPPTTTLQRLKGMTTGSLPTFVDAGSNFDGDSIDEDNWMLQLHKNNQSIAFMGDDTWSALFNKYINPELNFPYESLNVWDLHTVDNGVIEHLDLMLEKENTNKWDVLIGHFLGVDHVGHRYGPDHFSMEDKLLQMNKVIESVIDRIDDNTMLIVMGDHGMDSTGNHGGDSKDEVESTLFLYSKKQKFLKRSSKEYQISNLGKNYRSVNQIDLVPTLSFLLGLPVPFNNLGFPIDEAFVSENDLSMAMHLTIEQIQKFRDNTPSLEPELKNVYNALRDSFSKAQGDTNAFRSLAKEYQLSSLEECKGLWATFDLLHIGIGIVLLALLLTFLLTYARSIPSVRVLTMSFEFIGSVIAMSLLGLVISFSIYFVLRPTGFNLPKCLLVGLSLGIIIGFWAPIMDRFSVNWLWHQLRDFMIYNFNTWSFMGIVFVVFHCLIFASNSYIVWEDKMTLFFIITFGFCTLLGCFTTRNIPKEQRILGAMHSVTFIVLARLVSTISICREEQTPYCTSTFATSGWSIVLLHVSSYILPLIIRSFYQLSDSYHSAAPLWIGSGLRLLMFMGAVYWTIEYAENNQLLTFPPDSTMSSLIKSLKIAISRLLLFTSLVLGNFSWSKGPLCVKIDYGTPTEDDESPAPKLVGFENIYGSSYFLLVLNFFVAIQLVNKPMGAISLNILLIQILSLLELFEILQLRRNFVSSVILGLLGFQHFFSTGHQATIPSIQWEVGFMTNETIFFPFTHLNILLNTLGSFIIISLCIPLITFWRIGPSNKPITALSQVVTNLTTFLSYITLTSLSSLIFAAHFRRHLMVWKIFAPRFMLSGLLIILINVVLIGITFWLGTGKIITQVDRIFGK